jgi:hypothetical protein
MMRRGWAAGLAFLTILTSLALPATAAPPQKLWELSGFDGPSSVLYDARTDSFFVANVNGDETVRDGNGYIAQVGPDGRLIKKDWFIGLNAPRGMATYGNDIYVADLDQLVVVHKLKATLRGRHPALPSKLLNDVAADNTGRIYVTDMLGDSIYRLDEGFFGKWFESARLMAPTGIKVVKDELWVASWGRIVRGFETNEPGHVIAINLQTQKIRDVGKGYPIGNLGGLEPIGDGRFLVTDRQAGGLMLIDEYGRSQVILELPPGSADMGFNPLLKQLVVPLMRDGKIVAYQFD